MNNEEKANELIENLVRDFKYKPVPLTLYYGDVRETFWKLLPDWCREQNTTKTLVTKNGSTLCRGYERVVIGDYGAYVEFSKEQAESSRFSVAPGEQYRFEPRYLQHCKYLWYTVEDGSRVKIYRQLRTVAYADYRPDYYYVSVYECLPAEEKK